LLTVEGATSLPELKPGGSGAFTFTIVNTGGEDSSRTPIDLDLPGGISVQSITVDGTEVCSAKNPNSCLLRELQPGERAKVAVTITAGTAGQGGLLILRVGEVTVRQTITIAVPDTPETIIGKIDDVDTGPSELPPSDTGETPAN